MNLLKQHIEALVFCSEQSISLQEIKASLKISYGWEPEDEAILAALEELRNKYSAEEFSFELLEIAEGYQFLTKKDFYPTVSALIQHKARKRLSTAQMETLSIIAYRQPVTKTEVEHIRGVNCDYAVQKLLEKELIEIHGKSDTPGKPLLYITSPSFMDYFGIKSPADLPQLKDIHPDQNEIGTPAEYVESVPDEKLAEPVAEQAEEVNEIIADTEETIVYETEIVDMDLPDRKTIFLEHDNSEEGDETGLREDSEDYNQLRD